MANDDPLLEDSRVGYLHDCLYFLLHRSPLCRLPTRSWRHGPPHFFTMRVRYSLWLGLGAWSMPVASFEHQSRQAIDPRRRMLQSRTVINCHKYLAD